MSILEMNTISTAIKVDVEGAEGLVIDGLSGLLGSSGKPSDIFVEFHPTFLPVYGTSYEVLFQKIVNYGYKLQFSIPSSGQMLCHFRTIDK